MAAVCVCSELCDCVLVKLVYNVAKKNYYCDRFTLKGGVKVKIDRTEWLYERAKWIKPGQDIDE